MCWWQIIIINNGNSDKKSQFDLLWREDIHINGFSCPFKVREPYIIYILVAWSNTQCEQCVVMCVCNKANSVMFAVLNPGFNRKPKQKILLFIFYSSFDRNEGENLFLLLSLRSLVCDVSDAERPQNCKNRIVRLHLLTQQ